MRALPHVTFEEMGPDLEDINELQEWDNLEKEYSVSLVLLEARQCNFRDLKMLREQDFTDIGMPPVKRRRLMEAIETLTQGVLLALDTLAGLFAE